MKEYFLIIHKPRPAWIKGKEFHEQNFIEFGSNIHSLNKQRFLLLGGPFLDHSGGLTLIRVDDLDVW